jgi:CelD/BcsL family acetyltransferase involved in cellulose biosynthesis
MALRIERTDLDAAEAEWRSLSTGARGSVFGSPAWLRTWWAQFGGDRELLLLSARDRGELAAVLPLMRDGDILSFAGDTKVCDYMDFPCTGGREEDLLRTLFHSLGEEPWRGIVLCALPNDSPVLEALPGVAAEFGHNVAVTEEDVCPQMDLPGDWEEYVASLAKKDRHELRRKLRKLTQAGDAELEVLDSAERVRDALDDFLRMLRESRSDKAQFMTAEMERFFRELAPALAGEGVAEMTFLKLAGVRTAGVLCFSCDGATMLYNSGYDPAYSAFSVGLLSKALVLRRAIEQGQRRFDFLRGHERYKYELGARDVPVYRAVVTRGSV